MELRHSFTVPAPVGTTWDTFMDLAGVASCFPGATVTAVDGDRFEGTCKVKLGPIALVYAGSGTFVSKDEAAHRAVIEASGKDKRGNGTAGATVTVALVAATPSSTSVAVTTDLTVTGKPAQFGRGVMQDVSDKLLQQFVGCLEQRLATEPAGQGSAPEGEREAAPAPPDAPAAPAAPAAAAAPAGAPGDGREEITPVMPAPAPATSSNVHKPAFVPTGGEDNVLDVGSTVLPVLARSYGPQLVAGALGFLLGLLLGRRRR